MPTGHFCPGPPVDISVLNGRVQFWLWKLLKKPFCVAYEQVYLLITGRRCNEKVERILFDD